MSLLSRQFQRLPESSRSILLTSIYGLAAVIFELGIDWVPGGFAVLEAGDKSAGIITLHGLLRAQETLAGRSSH